MKFLVTGAAGFIGHALSMRLLERGDLVLGIDNLNPTYDVNLKIIRLKHLSYSPYFEFSQTDIADRHQIPKIFEAFCPDVVINLAAQGGVRRSSTDPHLFCDSNLQGFLNILEGCRHSGVKHLLYASSGAVYGTSNKLPFSVSDPADQPLSLYAATKRANELMAHSYSHLYGIQTVGLRFFTVYGPWGRPDMAIFGFTKAIIDGSPIELYNNGRHRRDFIYIDDVVDGLLKVIQSLPTQNQQSNPYRIYNLGNNKPVWLPEVVESLEMAIGKKAVVRLAAHQPGDILESHADMNLFEKDFDFTPRFSIQDGTSRFVAWYREYYKNDPL